MTDGPAARDTTDELAVAYHACRRIAAAHGRTYFLATRLLPAERRPAIHALYAFARMVDDIVDDSEADAVPGYASRPPEDQPRQDPADLLDLIEKQLRSALEQGIEHRAGTAPVLLALADTIDRYGIAPQHFWTFLDSMRMDVPGTTLFRNRYTTMAELHEYMLGSAAAIGLQVLPVLGAVVPIAEAEPAAAELGVAFQLTNFLRDIAEDLARGRVYLPADELAAFGVDPDLLDHCHHTGVTDPRVRRALAHLIALNRDVYRRAEPGIALLEPRVRPAIRAAATLYAAILDRIEHSGYAVFTHRAVVPRHRRFTTAALEFTAACRT